MDDANVFERFRFDSKRARDDTQQQQQSEPSPPPAASLGPLKREALVTPNVTSKKHKQTAAAAVRTVVAVGASQGSKWQERWHGICSDCFANGVKCTHHKEGLLRLLIVGHNPSDHAWKSGFSYSNPTNRMWSLIVGSLPPLSWNGILPADAPVSIQNAMPYLFGVGFTSIGLEPGNDAAKYGKATMVQWKNDFFRRLRAHAKRVCENEHRNSNMKHDDATPESPCPHNHGPLLIAFSGKRQFSFLFSPPLSKVENYGKQTRLPQDWPHDCVSESEVWVLPSSSGRSALTHEQRSTPYRQLAERLHTIPWPPAAATQNGIKSELTFAPEWTSNESLIVSDVKQELPPSDE